MKQMTLFWKVYLIGWSGRGGDLNRGSNSPIATSHRGDLKEMSEATLRIYPDFR